MPSIYTSGSGSYLWGILPQTGQRHGNRRSAHCAKVALAKPVCWACDWVNSKGMSGSLHHIGRNSPLQNPQRIRRVLQQGTPASILESQFSSASRSWATRKEQGYSYFLSWWLTPQVRSGCLTTRDSANCEIVLGSTLRRWKEIRTSHKTICSATTVCHIHGS